MFRPGRLCKMILSLILFIFVLSTLHLVLGNSFNIQRKSPVFVDKSELLATLFANSTPPHNLITCPFKFGKTINSDMIALFCDVEVDKTRKPRRQNDTFAYSIFSHLKICEHRSIIQDHLARHPVIHLSLSENLQVTPKTALGIELKRMMQKYRWLTNLAPAKLGSVDANDIEYLKKLQSDNPAKLRITEAILRISRTLFTYFNQSTVVLLIDNYDNVSCRGFVNEADARYTLEYYKYLNKMISRALLNGTEYISRTVITGLTSLPFSLPYCELGMIRHHIFLENHKFIRYYGYLEHEANELMIKFTMSENLRTTVLNFYKGYRIRGTNSHIYNPNTIYQYHMHRQKLRFESRDSLKVHTDPIKEFDLFGPFYQMLKFREKMLLLSINDRLNLPYDISSHHVGAFEEMGALKKRKYCETVDRHTETILTLFFELGYLKKADDCNKASNVYVWANVEPKISILHQLVHRFEHFSQYVTIGDVLLDIMWSKPAANFTTQIEYLSSNASRLYNGIRKISDPAVTQLQFQAMIYQSIGRRVNTPNTQNIRIIDKVPQENRTAFTSYDMYVRSPQTKKVIGVVVARFEKTAEEALNDAASIKFSANQTTRSVKYIAMNVIEQNEPSQVDALVHVELTFPQDRK